MPPFPPRCRLCGPTDAAHYGDDRARFRPVAGRRRRTAGGGRWRAALNQRRRGLAGMRRRQGGSSPSSGGLAPATGPGSRPAPPPAAAGRAEPWPDKSDGARPSGPADRRGAADDRPGHGPASGNSGTAGAPPGEGHPGEAGRRRQVTERRPTLPRRPSAEPGGGAGGSRGPRDDAAPAMARSSPPSWSGRKACRRLRPPQSGSGAADPGAGRQARRWTTPGRRGRRPVRGVLRSRRPSTAWPAGERWPDLRRRGGRTGRWWSLIVPRPLRPDGSLRPRRGRPRRRFGEARELRVERPGHGGPPHAPDPAGPVEPTAPQPRPQHPGSPCAGGIWPPSSAAPPRGTATLSAASTLVTSQRWYPVGGRPTQVARPLRHPAIADSVAAGSVKQGGEGFGRIPSSMRSSLRGWNEAQVAARRGRARAEGAAGEIGDVNALRPAVGKRAVVSSASGSDSQTNMPPCGRSSSARFGPECRPKGGKHRVAPGSDRCRSAAARGSFDAMGRRELSPTIRWLSVPRVCRSAACLALDPTRSDHRPRRRRSSRPAAQEPGIFEKLPQWSVRQRSIPPESWASIDRIEGSASPSYRRSV